MPCVLVIWHFCGFDAMTFFAGLFPLLNLLDMEIGSGGPHL